MISGNELMKIKEKVLNGELINKEQAMKLIQVNLNELCKAANDIRRAFCGDIFDICTIVNAKCGRCTEDCSYCAQSSHYHVDVRSYPLLGVKTLKEDAMKQASLGIHRYSVVTSGRKLKRNEINKMSQIYRYIHETVPILLCASHGLQEYDDFVKLKANGVIRYHNNLETSRRYFPSVCTTHTYDDKIATIRAAQKAGLSVCSGGIMGLGETMEDRIDMALELRRLGVKSVPINVLIPIKGTPLEDQPILNEDCVRRIVSIYRCILPDAVIRMAGGRGQFPDKGRQLFESGVNGAISGDMLTTSGIDIRQDIQMIEELGFKVYNIKNCL